MSEEEEEALVPLVRNRRSKSSGFNRESRSSQNLFSQKINITKDDERPTSNRKLTKLISRKFNLKSEEERKLYCIISLEVSSLSYKEEPCHSFI